MGNLSFCYMVTPSGDAGFTASQGIGGGLPIGISGMAGLSVSNASCLNDLGGPFTYGSGSAGIGPFDLGGSYEWGANGSGRRIWQATGGWTPSLDPLPASGAGGINWTWVGDSW